MSFRPQNARTLVSAFIGVNPGFNPEDFRIQNPITASKFMRGKLSEYGIKTRSFPGKAIYPQALGCPEGGEAIAAVYILNMGSDTIDNLKRVQNALKQVTITVVANSQTHGFYGTRSFLVDLKDSDPKDAAKRWQRLCEHSYDQSRLCVTGVILRPKAGRFYAQGVADPLGKGDADVPLWEKRVLETMKTIAPEAEVTFDNVGQLVLSV